MSSFRDSQQFGVPGLDGFVLSCVWGSWGFKAAPAAGKSIAELISTSLLTHLVSALGDWSKNGPPRQPPPSTDTARNTPK